MRGSTVAPSGDRDSIILSHLPQVELLARRLHRRCPQVDLEDLISAGTVGLIQAVDRFDPSRNLKLKTLAEHRISGALLDYLRQIDPLPRAVRKFQKLRDAAIMALSRTGEIPSVDEVAEVLGVSPEQYARLSSIITASEVSSIEESPFLRKLAS